MAPTLFANYYGPYIDKVWSRFQSTPMTIDTQAVGVVQGKISGQQLVFDDQKLQQANHKGHLQYQLWSLPDRAGCKEECDYPEDQRRISSIDVSACIYVPRTA